MDDIEFSSIEESPPPVGKKGKIKKQKKPKFNVFSCCFQTITCCLPSWARYFLLNVYHASVPETMWFEDITLLPHFYKNTITLLYNAAYFGIFFYFVKTAYDSNRQTFFVSLDSDAGECEEIGRPTTGEFLISSGVKGEFAYESSPRFHFNRSAYVLRLDSYQCKRVLYTATATISVFVLVPSIISTAVSPFYCS